MRENAAGGDITLPAEDLAKLRIFGGVVLQPSRPLKKLICFWRLIAIVAAICHREQSAICDFARLASDCF